MKTNIKKHNMNIAFGFIVFCAMMLLFIILPASAFAATGTLSPDTPPYVYCTYEQDGIAVDGNKLSDGTYDVKIHLSGMKNGSVFQFTATYDSTVVEVASTPSYLISDDNSEFDSMGSILSDGNIVFGFVSTNDDCSALGDDVVIAAVPMTFTNNSDVKDYVDAAEYITVSANPNYTFAQADYGDGYSDAYAPESDAYPDYNGNLYPMNCDVTPDFGHDVSGSIVVMTSPSGNTNNKAAYGSYTINVYTDEQRTEDSFVTSTTSVMSVDDAENKINTFTLTGLVPGTYYATVSYDYAIERNITITVADNDITAAVIPMIACDFNKDTSISGDDKRIVVLGSAASGEGYEYCDLNADGAVSGDDARIVVMFAASKASYDPLDIR